MKRPSPSVIASRPPAATVAPKIGVIDRASITRPDSETVDCATTGRAKTRRTSATKPAIRPSGDGDLAWMLRIVLKKRLLAFEIFRRRLHSAGLVRHARDKRMFAR